MSWAEWGIARAEAGQVIHIPEVQLSMENWPEVRRGSSHADSCGLCEAGEGSGVSPLEAGTYARVK